MAGSGLTLTSKPKGELKAYEPSLRDKIAWLLSDAFGGGDRSRVNWINEKARSAADFVPGVGDAVGIDETKRAYDVGNYGEAAFNGLTTAVGTIPGGGDLAAAGLKGASSVIGILGGPASNRVSLGWQKMFHGSTTPTVPDKLLPQSRLGIHTTDDPDLAGVYAGIDPFNEMFEPGGHIRPVEVNPGATFMGNNPYGSGKAIPNTGWGKDFAPAVKDFNPYGVDPELEAILREVRSGGGIDEVFRNRGYDSVEYSHHDMSNMLDETARVRALLTFDPNRVRDWIR